MADPLRTQRTVTEGTAAGLSVSKAQARQMVLVGTFALAAINVYKIKQGEPGSSAYKRLWGTGVVGVALAMVADFAPQIAGPFAVLIVLGSLTKGGDQIIQEILGGKFTVAGPTAPPGPRGPTAPASTAPKTKPKPGREAPGLTR